MASARCRYSEAFDLKNRLCAGRCHIDCVLRVSVCMRKAEGGRKVGREGEDEGKGGSNGE